MKAGKLVNIRLGNQAARRPAFPFSLGDVADVCCFFFGFCRGLILRVGREARGWFARFVPYGESILWLAGIVLGGHHVWSEGGDRTQRHGSPRVWKSV